MSNRSEDQTLTYGLTLLLNILREYGVKTDAADLESLVSAVAELVAEAAGDIASIKTREADLSVRRLRIAAKRDKLRQAIATAMEAEGRLSIRLPEATITLNDAGANLRIIDASLIPAEYLREEVVRKPDMALLRECVIEHGVVVDGVALDNGAPKLTIRRK